MRMKNNNFSDKWGGEFFYVIYAELEIFHESGIKNMFSKNLIYAKSKNSTKIAFK